jgi:hypothetical protein
MPATQDQDLKREVGSCPVGSNGPAAARDRSDAPRTPGQAAASLLELLDVTDAAAKLDRSSQPRSAP